MEILFWILALMTSAWIATFIVVHATTVRKLRAEVKNLREENAEMKKEVEDLNRAGWDLRMSFDVLSVEHSKLLKKHSRKRAELAELARKVHFAEMAFYEQGQLLDETKEKLYNLENWNRNCIERGERFRKEARELLANAEKKLTSFQQLVGKWHGHTPVPQPQEQKSDHAARVQTLVTCASLSPQLRRMLGM